MGQPLGQILAGPLGILRFTQEDFCRVGFRRTSQLLVFNLMCLIENERLEASGIS